MPTIYQNLIGGTLSADPGSGGTTMTSAALASLVVVSSPNTMWITLDPEGVNGAPEIIKVTNHTSSATTATITRAQQSTTARAHPIGTVWVHAGTKSDMDELPFRIMSARGDVLVGSGANATTRLALGAANTVLASDGTDPSWRKIVSADITDGTIATADIADSAITSAKIADATIATGDIADAAITAAKMEANFAQERVGGYWQRGTAQTFPDAATTTLQFDNEVEDSDGFSTSSGTAITVPAGLGGIYTAAVLLWGVGGVDTTNTNWYANLNFGGIGVPLNTPSADDPASASCSWTGPLSAGDTVFVQVVNASGVAAVTAKAYVTLYRVSR